VTNDSLHTELNEKRSRHSENVDAAKVDSSERHDNDVLQSVLGDFDRRRFFLPGEREVRTTTEAFGRERRVRLQAVRVLGAGASNNSVESGCTPGFIALRDKQNQGHIELRKVFRSPVLAELASGIPVSHFA